jgi:hypothetical protein
LEFDSPHDSIHPEPIPTASKSYDFKPTKAVWTRRCNLVFFSPYPNG